MCVCVCMGAGGVGVGGMMFDDKFVDVNIVCFDVVVFNSSVKCTCLGFF